MEANARRPEQLSKAGNKAENWKIWKKEFQNYMKITKGYEKSGEEQVAWLQNIIGPIGITAMEKIDFDDPEDENNMTIVLEKLDQIFDPAKNECEERYKFFTRSKKGNETLELYIRTLTEMSKSCNFGDQAEILIRDAVILDIKDKHLRNLLFEENNLTLEKLKTIYKHYEINSAKMKEEFKKSEPDDSASSRGQPRPPAPRRPGPQQERKGCWKCGRCHPIRACPAFNKECGLCKQLNHFTHCCPVVKQSQIESSSKVIPAVNESPFKSTKTININKNFNKSTPKNTSNEVPPSYQSLYPNVSNESPVVVPRQSVQNYQAQTTNYANKSNYHRRPDKTQKIDTDCTIQ